MAGRAIVIHSLEHASAALAAAERLHRPVVLVSAEGAAAYAGAGWFLSVLAAAGAAHPSARYEAVLDCGRNGGLALAALRQGCRAIVVDGPARLRAKLAAIAKASGARLVARPGRALDLTPHTDAGAASAAVTAWLMAKPPAQTRQEKPMARAPRRGPASIAKRRSLG